MNPTNPCEQMETLLTGTQPQAAADFTQQLESRLLVQLGFAPDERGDARVIKPRFSPIQQVLAAAAMILVATVVVFTVPPLRSLAQDIIGTIFVKVEDDTKEFNYPEIAGIYSAEAAQERLGFEIFVPSVLPVGYRPREVMYVTYDATTLDTAGEITEVEQKFRDAYATFLAILQVRGYTESGEWAAYGGKPVGVSATIETVVVGGVAAEYVRGGWRFEGNTRLMIWDNDYPRQILVWWQNGEIVGVATQTERLSQADLIAVAEGIIADYGSSPASHDHIFVNASTDQQSIEQFVPILAYEMTLNDFFAAIASTSVNTYDEAQSLVDFTIYSPTFPLTDLYIQGITIESPFYDPFSGQIDTTTAVQQNYGSTKTDYVRLGYQLTIRQTYNALSDPTFSGIEIGSSAEIEHLQIGEIDAQYVVGGWRPAYSNYSTWTNEVPQHQLAWWQNGFLIQITEVWNSDMSLMSEERIIAIAESIITTYQDEAAPQTAEQPVPGSIFVKVDEDTREITQEPDRILTAQERADFAEYNRLVDTVPEAEALVGFDILEPEYLPDDLTLNAVAVSLPNPQDPSDILTSTGLEYLSDGYMLVIGQIAVDSDEWQGSGVSVGASANLETVMIGEIPAQYVRGDWRTSTDQTSQTWDNDYPRQRMAWWQDGYLMHMRASSVERLSRDAFIAIAESIVLQGDNPGELDIDFFRLAESDTRTETKVWEPYVPSDDPFPLTLEDAAEQVGFEYYQPAQVYDLRFAGARYDPDSKSLFQVYRHPTDEAVILILTQQRAEEDLVDAWLDRSVGAGATIETVQIGDLTGQFVRGRWYPADTLWILDAEPGDTVTYELEWDPYAAMRRLIWEQDGYLFELASIGAFRATPRRDELIAIAASVVARSSAD